MYNTTADQPKLVMAPTSSFVQYTSRGLCPGDQFAPGYVCLDTSNPNWVTGWKMMVAGAGSSLDGVLADGGSLQKCPDIPPPHKFLLDYTPVNFYPQPVNCYASCRYGMQSNGVSEYNTQVSHSPRLQALGTDATDDPKHNIFLLDIMLFIDIDKLVQICSTTCKTGPCNNVGYYRPETQLANTYITTACGPACGIIGTCSDGEGCSLPCTNLPPHAQYTSGANGVGNPRGCAWVCDPGWHLNDNQDGCDSCNQTNVTQYCGSIYFALQTGVDCTPKKTRGEVCMACPRISNFAALQWNSTAGVCQYTCDFGYYFKNNPPMCVSCSNVTLTNACPVGTYLDVSTCNTAHTPPLCMNCTAPQTPT